jgi:hypothetical protein
VVGEWVKAFRAGGEEPTLYYWSAHGGVEVEVKATATPTPRHAEGLARWLDLAGKRARGVLACRVERPTPIRPGIRAVPWHLAWTGRGGRP